MKMEQQPAKIQLAYYAGCPLEMPAVENIQEYVDRVCGSRQADPIEEGLHDWEEDRTVVRLTSGFPKVIFDSALNILSMSGEEAEEAFLDRYPDEPGWD